VHLRARMSQRYTFPMKRRPETARERKSMKLKHLIYALVTLAAVSGIAMLGPSQADNGGYYLQGGAAS
jgi:hypothetical protein